MEAGWKYDQGTCTDADMAMAKLKATEMLVMVADEAIDLGVRKRFRFAIEIFKRPEGAADFEI